MAKPNARSYGYSGHQLHTRRHNMEGTLMSRGQAPFYPLRTQADEDLQITNSTSPRGSRPPQGIEVSMLQRALGRKRQHEEEEDQAGLSAKCQYSPYSTASTRLPVQLTDGHHSENVHTYHHRRAFSGDHIVSHLQEKDFHQRPLTADSHGFQRHHISQQHNMHVSPENQSADRQVNNDARQSDYRRMRDLHLLHQHSMDQRRPFVNHQSTYSREDSMRSLTDPSALPRFCEVRTRAEDSFASEHLLLRSASLVGGDQIPVFRSDEQPVRPNQKTEHRPGTEPVYQDRYNDPLKQLSDEIHNFVQHRRQTAKTSEKKQHLRAGLFHYISQVYQGSSLHMTGSSVNGFDENQSDVDMCLLMPLHNVAGPDWSKQDRRPQTLSILRKLQLIFAKQEFYKRGFVIPARVPILHFEDKISGLDVDINVGNHMGIRNSHLLRLYCAVDKRVAPLGIIVKHWTKKRGINNPKEGFLSSYSLMLMVIHYLQVCDPPVLPAVQTDCMEEKKWFLPDSDVNRLSLMDFSKTHRIRPSENRQSLGELLVGLFAYFANFDYTYDAMSVRLGKVLPRRGNAPFVAPNSFICVEEPFDLTNAARVLHDGTKFLTVRHEIRNAANALQHNPSLQGLGLC